MEYPDVETEDVGFALIPVQGERGILYERAVRAIAKLCASEEGGIAQGDVNLAVVAAFVTLAIESIGGTPAVEALHGEGARIPHVAFEESTEEDLAVFAQNQMRSRGTCRLKDDLGVGLGLWPCMEPVARTKDGERVMCASHGELAEGEWQS